MRCTGCGGPLVRLYMLVECPRCGAVYGPEGPPDPAEVARSDERIARKYASAALPAADASQCSAGDKQ